MNKNQNSNFYNIWVTLIFIFIFQTKIFAQIDTKNNFNIKNKNEESYKNKTKKKLIKEKNLDEFEKYTFDKPITNIKNLGDHFYNKKDFPLAQIEYERVLISNYKSNNIITKLALTLQRQDKFEESIRLLSASELDKHVYLSMYAALKLGNVNLAQSKFAKYTNSKSFSKNNFYEFMLLNGTILIENRKFNEAIKYYTNIQKESSLLITKKKSGYIISAMLEYENKVKKSPSLSGFLAAIFPGGGHFYAKHNTDGAIAFLTNFFFATTTAVLYSLENKSNSNHAASILFGLVGFSFYFSNITGAIKATERYNNFEERIFQQQLRDQFFNLNEIERVSKTISD